MGKERKYAVILAGGAGLRAGGDVPKQFQMLNGVPVLWWSVRAFHEEDPETRIRIVVHPGFFDLWDILFSELPMGDRAIPVELVCGGRSRLESVRNGIEGIDVVSDGEVMIAVHDAARPLLTPSLISRGWEKCRETGAAIPFVPMTDSIRRLLPEGSEALDRNDYVRVQTPQVFNGRILKDAYSGTLLPSMTDDASVVEAAGIKVSLYEGSEFNLKITHPLDIEIASLIIRESGIK